MTRLLALGGVAGPILFTAACIGVAGLTERIVVTEVFLWFVALGWVARRSIRRGAARGVAGGRLAVRTTSGE